MSIKEFDVVYKSGSENFEALKLRNVLCKSIMAAGGSVMPAAAICLQECHACIFIKYEKDTLIGF